MTGAPRTVLEIDELRCAYGLATVVESVSLCVPERSVVALLGRNGMGKTTLIRSIMGLVPPAIRSGDVRYKDTSLVGLSPHRIAQLGMGYVPQGRHVFRSLTVREHLDIVERAPAGSDGERWDVDRVVALFPRLAERARHRGSELSGGEQQMLAIARALMTNPDLLIMDEPSEGLAPLLIRNLGTQLLSLKGSHLSILLVEQNVNLALELADDVYVIERGRIVYHGSPDSVRADATIRSRHLGVG